MKYVMLILTLLSNTYAQQMCNDLRDKMIVLENQIQKSTLPQCSETITDFCCRPDEPDSCLSFRNVETKYNDAMAKLVIYEGILALGQSIENNHKVIQHMDLERVDLAQKSIDEFFDSYNKARLISNSLELNGENGIWTEYNGVNAAELESHLNSICAGDKYDDFCKSYDQILAKSPEKKTEYLNSLHGFATADKNILSNYRSQNYDTYKDYLSITIDGENIPYDKLEEHPQVLKLNQLKSKIAELTLSQGDDVAKEILKLSKELNDLKVKYNTGINVKSRFKEFISEDVEKGIAGLNQTTQLLLGSKDFKDNLDKMVGSFETQQASNKSTLNKQIREFIQNSPDKSCNSGESEIACITRLCAPNENMLDSCSNNDQSLLKVYKEVLAVNKLDQTQKDLVSASVCMSKESLDEQEQCILAMKEDLFDIASDEVEKLRRELAYVEKIRMTMNQGNPFKDLQQEKFMATYAFKKSGCINDDDLEIVTDLHSSCGVSEIDSFNNNVLKLKSDVDNIVINLSRDPNLNKDLKFDDNLMSAYAEDFLNDCKNDSTNVLCKFYKSQKEKESEKKKRVSRGYYSTEELYAMRNNVPGMAPVRSDDYKNPDDPTWEDGAVAVVATGANLLPGFIQLGYMKQSSNYQMQSGAYALSNMYRRRDYMNSVYEQQQNVQFQNYGWNYYNPYDATGFSGNNTSGLYYSPYDYSQLSFASPTMVSPTSFDFSVPQTGSSSTNSTVGFSF